MKGRFEGYLILKFRDEPVDGKWFVVDREFSYISNIGSIWRVPKGTNTDFASIPRGFRWLISRVGKYGMCAVFHDWLCESGVVARKKADKLFLESMENKGVNWFRRRLMYFGVRAYSIITFKK